MLEDQLRTDRVARVREHPVKYWAALVNGETLVTFLLGSNPFVEALHALRNESCISNISILLFCLLTLALFALQI